MDLNQENDFNGEIFCYLQSNLSEINEARSVCLLNIPGYLIPHDLLDFLKSILNQVESIKLFRQHSEIGYYIALVNLISSASSQDIVLEFNEKPFSSLDETICLSYIVKEIVFDPSEHSETQNPRSLLVNENKPDSNPNLKTEKFQYRKAVHITGSTPCHRPRLLSTDKEELQCAVCLENISIQYPLSFTLYCGHTFHIECVSRLESPQCPVCRYVLLI
jgi:hypothetical protein